MKNRPLSNFVRCASIALIPILPLVTASAQEAETPVSTVDMETLEASGAHGALEELGLYLYGFVQLDAFADTGRVDPAWVDMVRPSKLTTSNNPDEFGSDGEFNMSVRATTFGAKGQYEAGENPLKTWLEFDLVETGNKAGETGLHLRHAWGEWGAFGAGQTHSVFMDITIFPNSLQYWGPPGMVFNRNPQVRYTQQFDGSRLAIGLEQQNAGLDAGVLHEIDPDLAANVQAKSIAPDLTAQYRSEFSRGHWQLAGVLRALEYETKNNAMPEASGSDLGWGVNLSTGIRTIGQDMLKLQFVAGEGIASFMNDGGSNLAGHNGDGVAVPLVGMLAYYDHYWTPKWASTIGYSFNDVDNRNGQAADAFSKGSYATANILHIPNEHIAWSIEAYWLEREDMNGATGDNFRLQFSVKWDFSLGAFVPSFNT